MLYILPVGSVTYFHDLDNVVGGSYNTVYIGLLIVRLFRFTLFIVIVFLVIIHYLSVWLFSSNGLLSDALL